MIREINSSATEEPYVNILELIYMFLVVELHIAMSTIKLFDMETKQWNIRRMFWYSIIGIPSLALLAVFATAAIKFILN